jgi:O-antigen ligase
MAYLMIDFGRPMAWIAPLAMIKPAMLVGIWAFGVTLARGLRRGIPRPLWYMFAFMALMAFHVPFAVNNGRAFWGLEVFAILVFGGVLPLAMLPRDLGDVRSLATAYVLCHIPTAIHGLIHRGDGLGGWMMDTNDLAFALNAAIGVGVYLMYESKEFGRKLLLAATLCLLVAGTVSTFSRGGFLGLTTLCVYMLFAGPRRGRILLAIVLAGAGLVAFAPAEYWDRIHSIAGAQNKGETGEDRLYLWSLGWQMFVHHPIVGVGTDNYGIWAPVYEDKERAELEGEHTWGRVAHSLYFTLISEHGLVGLAIFLAMIIWVFRTGRPLRREGLKAPDDPDAAAAGFLASGLMAGMVGALVTGAFITVLYYPVIWILTGLLAALDAVRREAKRSARIEAGAGPSSRRFERFRHQRRWAGNRPRGATDIA